MYKFLWFANCKNYCIAFVKYKTVAMPKGYGGWGLKNVHFFGLSLALNNICKISTERGLWRDVLEQKIIALGSFMDLIRNPK